MRAPIQFQIGQLDCRIIHYGETGGHPGYFFPEETAEDLVTACDPHLDAAGNIELAYTSLVVRSSHGVVVIDTGLEHRAGEGSPLAAGLREVGAAETDVQHVILSHGHPDHLGGLARVAEASREPVFSSARHHLWGTEWEHWTATKAVSGMAAEAQRHLGPIEPLVELHSVEAEILPGVALIPTPGHTPGHLSVVIRSQGETAVYLGDVVAHQVMVEHPDWQFVFDSIPQLARTTRRRMVEEVAASGATIVASHLDLPGRIVDEPSGSGIRFEPVIGAPAK